jgi:aspartate kinase
MLVMKFGGTSVKDAEAMKKVIEIVINSKSKRKLVVVSAMSKITDSLIEVAKNISLNKEYSLHKLDEIMLQHLNEVDNLKLNDIVSERIVLEFDFLKNEVTNQKEFNSEVYDLFVSRGELLSSYILSKAFEMKGLRCYNLDSKEVIKTDSNFGEAKVNQNETNKLIQNKLNEIYTNYNLVVAGGFIASNFENEPTTLGRGGSDYSAAIYASAFEANELEIWTDVDGIFTCDPRMIKSAKRILKLSYTEAGELAYFGAKVLHPKTILPAIEKNIPVIVKNTFNPSSSGTRIENEKQNIKMIKAIAFRKNISIINIQSNRMLGAYGFLSRVFEIFNKNETSVDLVTTSEVSISVTIDDIKNLHSIIKDLEEFSLVSVSHSNAVISVVGEGIKLTAGIAARYFGVLKGINIIMVSFGASEVNLSIIVKESDLENSVNLLHSEFFSSNLDNEVFLEVN